MKKNRQIIILMILVSIAHLSFANQIFYVKPDDEIKAIISKHELTRIVMPANIELINSIEGEIEYSIQDKNLYIKSQELDKPINLFVRTNDKNTYKLLLITKDIAATQIFILADDQEEIPSSYLFMNNISEDKKKSIVNIIDVALIPKHHIGYQIVKKDKFLKSPLRYLSMHLIGQIKGLRLKADKIIINNISEENIHLEEKFFIDKFSNLAVFLNKRQLAPNEAAILIKVREDE